MRWISNVRLAGPPRGGDGGDGGDGAAPRWRLAIDDDQRISQLQPIATGTAAAGEDWHGDWLSLAGVDLQINGGLGLAFPELDEAQLPQLEALRELLWRDGVEAICPTLVTCGVGALRQSLQLLATARQQRRAGHCQLLGAHLEGPFLAPARRGAHPLAHICAPSLAALAERIAGFRGGPTADIALVTLAPELEGSAELIAALKRHAIAVSLGHSDANESQAQAAFAARRPSVNEPDEKACGVPPTASPAPNRPFPAASATATFLFRQFFLTIPDELVEAARIDGAGPMKFFKDVLLPLSTTSIAALFVIQFIYGWNQYLWPLLMTTDENMYPVVMGIKRMISGGDAATEWNAVMATAMLAMIPPALVVLLMQKWFVKGLVDTEK